MIYRLRIILDNDTDEDIFRDIELKQNSTLEDFHNSIIQSFGFNGNEMASFYISDEQWIQGEEISLFDLNEAIKDKKLMSQVLLNEVLDNNKTRLIYVYDFFNLWTFLIELAEIVEESSGVDYPNLIFANGQIPEEVPERKFKAENGFDDMNEDDNDSYNDYDDFYN
jgi:hypothetical protein